jgi:hypothetical protein
VKEQIQRYIPVGLCTSALVAFLSIWEWRTTGRLSGSGVATFAAFSLAVLIYGGFVTRLSPLPSKLGDRLALQFLLGFLLFNTCLFALWLVFSWGVVICFLVLVAIAPITLFVRGNRSKRGCGAMSFYPDLLCLVISGAGATLWCADALSPIVIDEQYTVFKFWPDSFFHMRLIGTFAEGNGLGGVFNLEMAGASALPYHYASYLTPAAVERLTGANAFEVFVGFQLPFGILLTGLAAFALVASLWGAWPGVAASCGIILFPDAYQQGFANRYLSYDYLQQANLAGLYGVSCAAAAWIFILSGCKSGRNGSIVIGYALILVTLAYKAHIFVANAFLALIYPCLFFKELRASRRWLVATALLLLFAAAVWLSQKNQGVPNLYPDFSFHSAYSYTIGLIDSSDSGLFKSLFSWLILPNRPPVVVGLSAASMILLSSFGMWIGAFGVIFLSLRKRIEPAVLFFPLLVIVNYIVMALGLSLNTTAHIGGSDELQNRPVVWAYFAVVSWTAGAAYAVVFGNSVPRRPSVRLCMAVLALSSFMIPWHFARTLQTMPAWKGLSSFNEFGRFPSCLVSAAQYIRQHSHSEDVIQDSENDPKMLVGAFAERQEFAVDWMFVERPKGLKERLNDLELFKASTSEADLAAAARKNKIAWYVLHPETKVAWPSSVLRGFSFDCDGYRVYRFVI